MCKPCACAAARTCACTHAPRGAAASCGAPRHTTTPPQHAPVTATNSLSRQRCAASAGSTSPSAERTALLRLLFGPVIVARQPNVGLQRAAMSKLVARNCWLLMPLHRAAAVMLPPDAPATRVALVRMPSCLSTAVVRVVFGVWCCAVCGTHARGVCGCRVLAVVHVCVFAGHANARCRATATSSHHRVCACAKQQLHVPKTTAAVSAKPTRAANAPNSPPTPAKKTIKNPLPEKLAPRLLFANAACIANGATRGGCGG